MARPHPTRFPLSILVSLCPLALAACQKAPAEPEGRAASTAEAAPAVKPLTWDAPGSWTKLNDPPTGTKKVSYQKASYQIEKTGNDKEGAEMNVYFLGTGAKGDPAGIFKEWSAQFDAGSTTTQEELPSKSFKVEAIEISGTYKIALTPPMKGKKQPPVAMVKNNWRLYGAVVKTPDRGNWYFKITGPDETVQAAKAAFRTMLDSVR